MPALVEAGYRVITYVRRGFGQSSQPWYVCGGFDDATIKGLQDGVKADRIAFLDNITTNFFAFGDRTDLMSEEFRLYNRDIAAFA